MNSTKRNVGLLAGCQAMLMSNNSSLIAINGLAGLALAPLKGLATLPVTSYVIGAAASTMLASFHMKRVGRRRGLEFGTAWSVAGALICALAVWQQAFWLLCLGSLVLGVYNAYGQYYRFAAADVATPDFRATAISLVLAGGLAGGILGPTLTRATLDAVGPHFAGAYLTLIVFAVVTFGLLHFLQVPTPTAYERTVSGRPLSEIAAQPAFLVAVLSAAIGYGVMNFLMVSTPIAMQVCGHPFGDAAFVISSHVIGMFAPSFFTGPLIRRFGTLPVMFAGAVLNFAAIAVALSGISVPQFWAALVLLGVGWNFLYIGGTTLLTTTYRPEERAKVQGANDQTIFIVMAISSFTSGMTVTGAGWERVNLAALPLVAVVALAILGYAIHSRRKVSPA
ncbi:MAG TPA: MFS transporter [Burkholderiales bacterium]|jgi:MFS family permease|nr:MFS transporter [Burkholderiales bacterium]